jgi:hypothetical protein
MSRVGEQAPGSSAISASAAFLASCLDLTPDRPPVTAADQGRVGAASVSGHRGVDAVGAGAWLPPPDAFGGNDAAKRVPDACSSKARLHIRKHERASRIDPPCLPFLQPGSHNSTKESHLPPQKHLGSALGRRGAAVSRWHAACDGGAGSVGDMGTGGALPGMSIKPSLADVRQRLLSTTVGLAPTAARSAPTTRTDGTRYRPFSP